jgi:hypothetical protein
MKYEDEDEEDNDIDQINKLVEKKLKLDTEINEKINDSENYVKKSIWKILDDSTYSFKQNIERVWEAIKSINFKFILEHYPIIFKTGSNIYDVGNIFEGKLINSYEFNAKVIKVKIFSDIKKIEWLFFIGNGEVFRIKLKLYKVTEDNSTVINLKMKYIPSNGENVIFKIKEKFKINGYFKDIEKLLKKESVRFYQYESGIILGNMEEIWDILTDNTKLVSIAPNNSCFVPININNVKVGDISKVPLSIKNIDGFLDIKLDLKENKEGWNKWAFGYSILGGGPFKIIKQTVQVELTKINKYETQLSVFTKIYENIDMKMVKHLSEKKKYVIASFKDYFENFSTPLNDKDNENENIDN